MKRDTFILEIVIFALIAAGIAYAFSSRSSVPGQPAVSPVVATSTIPAPSPASASGSFSLKIGQKAQFGNVTLTLYRITEDSRCPANVNCIWAGRIAAEFDAVSGKTAERITLKTDSAAAFGGYDFKIESVKPGKSKTIIQPSDYILIVSYVGDN